MREVYETYLPCRTPFKHWGSQRFREVSPKIKQCQAIAILLAGLTEIVSQLGNKYSPVREKSNIPLNDITARCRHPSRINIQCNRVSESGSVSDPPKQHHHPIASYHFCRTIEMHLRWHVTPRCRCEVFISIAIRLFHTYLNLKGRR